MRRYETIFILDPDLSDDQQDPIFERLTDLIPKHDGLLVVFDKWGTKKLAYEIKKKARGYYVRMDYCGNGLLVDEIERFFRIDDRVLKYMTVLTDEAVDIEKVKEEIVQLEKSVEQPSPEVEKQAPQEFTEVSEPESAKTETDQTEPEKVDTETDQTEDNREA